MIIIRKGGGAGWVTSLHVRVYTLSAKIFMFKSLMENGKVDFRTKHSLVFYRGS